jgi:predicted RNase H-like nuclease
MTKDGPYAGRVMGVDGCPGGWIAVLREPGGPAEMLFAGRFAELAELPDVAVIAVDMPIGLPDRIGPHGRGPERALRPSLGERQSAVFSVPSRAAVYASDYGEACRTALATSDPPKKVSKQAFFLFPKIREIDALLREDAALRDRVFECHPEGSFAMMNGGPLLTPKKTKSRPHEPGLADRRRLLAEVAGFDRAFLGGRPPRGVGADDLLDACACCFTAERIRRGAAISFPPESETDAFGLRMAIRA